MTTPTTPVKIRPLRPTDWPQWQVLWTAYLDFYHVKLPQKIYDSSFARMLGDDPQDFDGLVAEQDGRLVGLTHFLFHRHGWRIENVCYLQDLYTDPSVRGTGVGRKLIEAVYAAADAKGVQNVYWLTNADNAVGRRLYDRVGTLTSFIKYQRPS